MATQEQIAEAMNAMQRQIAELASQLAEERHRSANLDRVAQVLNRWTTKQAQQPVARLVDTRGIGRPSNFGSGEEKSLEKSFASSGTAGVGRNDSSAHHSPARGTTIRLRSGSYRSSDGSGGQDASSPCGVDASDRG